VVDLERATLPFEDNSVSEFLLSHVLEHVNNTLPLMQELYRVAAPDAVATVRLPYGSSDDAWEDPTHVRPYFLNSLNYFGQPYFWKADYGYRGDWKTENVYLLVDRRFIGQSADEIMTSVRLERNVVAEMVAVMNAVKPIRAQDFSLHTKPRVHLSFQ
jgi:ubiquinone/menaquinone biosynthesis C-methylase UbiE